MVEANPTDAYAIGTAIGGFRGRAAFQRTNGFPMLIGDYEMREAQTEAGKSGIWQELSSSLSLAGLRRALQESKPFEGPVVCISTSSGFKDRSLGTHEVPQITARWTDIQRALRRSYGLIA